MESRRRLTPTDYDRLRRGYQESSRIAANNRPSNQGFNLLLLHSEILRSFALSRAKIILVRKMKILHILYLTVIKLACEVTPGDASILVDSSCIHITGIFWATGLEAVDAESIELWTQYIELRINRIYWVSLVDTCFSTFHTFQ